jgi:hypothetical protein
MRRLILLAVLAGLAGVIGLGAAPSHARDVSATAFGFSGHFGGHPHPEGHYWS